MVKQNNHSVKLSRREREKEAHRQEILTVAMKVFSEKGYYAATLDEIALKAEFSKGTIYLYFSNKEDILNTILKDAMEQWYTCLQQTITGTKSLEEELHDFYHGIAEEIYHNNELFDLMHAHANDFFKTISEENRNEFLKFHTSQIRNFEKRIEQAIEDDDIRDIDPKALTGITHGFIHFLCSGHNEHEKLKDIKRNIDTFIDMLFNGIAKKERDARE